MKIQGNAGHQIIFHKKWSFIGQKVCGHVPQIFVNTCAMATSAEVALALFSNKWKANRKAATQLLFRLEMWNVVCALLFLFFFSFCSCPTPVAKGPPCHERVKNWTFNLKVHENLKQNFVHVAENRSVMSSIVYFFCCGWSLASHQIHAVSQIWQLRVTGELTLSPWHFESPFRRDLG